MSAATRLPNADCEIMVFQPTMEEFKDFNRYVLYMESQGAHRGGVAKIIPPKEWKPCKSYDHIDNLIIPAPISQVVQGQKGLYTQWNIQKKASTVKEFRRLANTERYAAPFHENYEDLERKYWKNITFNPAIYGADISGTLYDENVKEWNVGKLNSVLDIVENESGVKIEGVNTAYLYFGMWKSSFAWHTEDMDLYSINYIHFGAPKSWYSVPPEHGKRLERLAKGFFPSSHNQCSAFLRHKMTVISPSVLKQYGIPFNKITHEAGEFMVTFPFGYHSGFNHGYNCAESTNFASPRWISYGCDSVKCRCRNDMVFINMDVFMRVFKPSEYEAWKTDRIEIKPCHTAVPEPPDFSKPPVHWRVEAQAAQDLYQQQMQMKRKSISSIASEEEGTSKQSKEIKKVSVKLSPMKPSLEKQLQSVKSPKRKVTKSPNHPTSPSRGSLSYNQSLQLSSQLVTLTTEQHNLIKDVVRKTKLKKTSSKISQSSSPRKPMIKADPFANLKALNSSSEKLNRLQNDELVASPQDEDDDVFTSHDGPVTIFDRVKMKNRKMSTKQTNKIRKSESFIDEFKKTIKKNKKNVEDSDDYVLDDYSDSDSMSEEEYTNDEQEAPSYLKYLKNESANKNRKFSNTPSPRPPLKRRHPVSRKGPSKKAGPNVVLKETDDSSGSDQGSKPTKKSKTKKSTKIIKATDGYPALWLQRKSSFKSERQYNTLVAKLPPYCAICTLFQPYYQQTHNSEAKPPPLSTLLERAPEVRCGQSSKPIIPEQNFASSTEEAAPLASCELLDERGESVLLQCESCALQVHASCYGVRKPPLHGSKWCCDRCSFKAWVAQCCLCCLKGGALKPVNDGTKWAHVTCSVAIPEISFDDIPGRNGISIKKISSIRQKLKCVYCKKMNQSSRGYCIQCCAGRCSTSFHVTCATSAGIHMELADWPFPVSVYCKRHAAIRDKRKKSKKDSVEDLPDIFDEQTIIGKHRNRRYYRCKVLSQTSQMFHHVEFEDKSWSNNVLTEDFVDYNYSECGLPTIGALIKLRWTDNKTYDTRYQGCKKKHMLMVEFENGDVLTIKRSDCYVTSAEMPKHLLRKLSSATERKEIDYTSKSFRKTKSTISEHIK